MDDPLTFADLLLWLSPLLALLWVWGLWRVRRDMRIVSRAGPEVARCGLPRGSIGRPSCACGLRGRRPHWTTPSLRAG